jgi:hypothetical protein
MRVDALHIAVDTDHRWHPRGQVQVRGIVFHGECQELRNIDGH